MESLLIETAQTSHNRALFAAMEPPRATARVAVSTASKVTVPETHVLLQGDLDAGLRLVAPLLVTIERDEQGWFVVGDDIFLQWGEGETANTALADYRSTLAEYYALVSAGALSCEGDRRELQRLQRYIHLDG